MRLQLVRNHNQFDVIVTGNMFATPVDDHRCGGSIGCCHRIDRRRTQAVRTDPRFRADIAGKAWRTPSTIMSLAMMFAIR